MKLQNAMWIALTILVIFTECCQTKALDEACTPPTNRDSDECAVANSECKTTTCVCKDGFIKDGAACSKVKVSENTCTKDGPSQCQHTPKAECDNKAQGAKCKCSEGYAENKADGTTCVKTVNGTDCTPSGTQCDSIPNSHCKTDKCACNDGFVMNIDVCTADNGAAMFQFGPVLLTLSLLTTFLVSF